MRDDVTNELLAWITEDVLRVRPELCSTLVSRLAQDRPAHALPEAIVERHRVRAAFSGVLSGMRSSTRAALIASLLEHVEHMRRGAMVRGSLALLSDPRFFDREDWPRVALGLSDAMPLRHLLLRESARFGVRWSFIRLARFAGDRAPAPLGALLGGLTGAAFNAAEDALEARALTNAEAGRPAEIPAEVRAAHDAYETH